MSDPDAYVMLIASLPSPEALFFEKQPPLSRHKLERRLRVLAPEDAEALRLVEDALDWRQLPITMSEQDVIDRGRAGLARLRNPTLRSIVRRRLEIRTCVAALRRRARGEEPPPPGTPWGFGRWVGHIARNWSEPGFRLDGAFPWVRQADGLMRQGDTIALKRLLLQQAYKDLQRQTGEHLFDLEAVVIYVLKYNIVDRWGRYNAEAAARRFEDLTLAGLGAYANLSLEGGA